MPNTEARLTPSNAVHLRIGPQVDNVAMEVSERFNDPGDGLGANGRRCRCLRRPSRSLPRRGWKAAYAGDRTPPFWKYGALHLGIQWEEVPDAEPIELKLGERVRFVLINDTMMEHPIHLHGLWSELENGHGEFNPYKHTVIVKPAERLTYLVSADTPGQWAYHCHSRVSHGRRYVPHCGGEAMSALRFDRKEVHVVFRASFWRMVVVLVISAGFTQHVSAQMSMPSPGTERFYDGKPGTHPRKVRSSLRVARVVRRVNSVGMAKAGLEPI